MRILHLDSRNIISVFFLFLFLISIYRRSFQFIPYKKIHDHVCQLQFNWIPSLTDIVYTYDLTLDSLERRKWKVSVSLNPMYLNCAVMHIYNVLFACETTHTKIGCLHTVHLTHVGQQLR